MSTESKNLPATSKSEHVIQNIVGCGPFQVILFFSVFGLAMLSIAFIQFMSFGSYNPGWRCLDSILNSTDKNTTSTFSTTFSLSGNRHHHNNYTYHTTTPESNDNVATLTSSTEYITDNDHCPLFESCEQIEFKPGTSTIVTEWGLLCDKAWIAKIIISLEYAGMLVGTAFAGYLGDLIGRKTTMYGSQAMVTVLLTVSIFSTSWQMFAVLRFLIGLSVSGLHVFYYVFLVEFVTIKWRSPLPNIPYWPILCIVFGLFCMLFKDWRNIQIIAAVLAGLSVLPGLWLPESPRWLEVKKKTEKLENAMRKIARINNKTLPPLGDLNIEKGTCSIGGNDKNNEEKDRTETQKDENISETLNVHYNIFHLFKPAYRKYTLLLAVPWFSMGLIFFALGFGVKELSGDFYINNIIIYAFEIPFSPMSMVLPNLVGRRPAGIALSGLSGICLLTAACCHRFTSGYARTTGVLILAFAARITISGFWGVMMTYTAEIYPTVVRGLGTSWGSFMIRVSGIVAPFLIPDADSSFFVCYIIMAGIAILCSGIVTQLPETKKKNLKDKFEEC